jgi:hypothetical protein
MLLPNECLHLLRARHTKPQPEAFGQLFGLRRPQHQTITPCLQSPAQPQDMPLSDEVPKPTSPTPLDMPVTPNNYLNPATGHAHDGQGARGGRTHSRARQGGRPRCHRPHGAVGHPDRGALRGSVHRRARKRPGGRSAPQGAAVRSEGARWISDAREVGCPGSACV